MGMFIPKQHPQVFLNRLTGPRSDEGVPDWQKTFVLKAPDTPGFEMCPLCWLYKRHQLVDLAGFSFIPSVFVHRARWMEFEAGFQLHYLNTYAMPENAEKMNLFPREEDPIKRVQCLLASEDRTDLTQNLNQMQWSLGSDES